MSDAKFFAKEICAAKHQTVHLRRRLKIPLARKNLYKRSFLPMAVIILHRTVF
jgi:hypothetical protein